MTESPTHETPRPEGDGGGIKKKRRKRRRGKKPNAQATVNPEMPDDSPTESKVATDSNGVPDSESVTSTDRPSRNEVPPQSSAENVHPSGSTGYSNQSQAGNTPQGRGPRDRGGPPRPRFDKPRDGERQGSRGPDNRSHSDIDKGPRPDQARGRGQDRPGNDDGEDDSGPRGKKRRKPRTKQCVNCLTPCTTIHRVQLDYRKQWVFICDICWPSRCIENPHYSYGGLWVSGRIVKPESQLRDEARARYGHGHHPHHHAGSPPRSNPAFPVDQAAESSTASATAESPEPGPQSSSTRAICRIRKVYTLSELQIAVPGSR